jgi:hypothetical protein
MNKIKKNWKMFLKLSVIFVPFFLLASFAVLNSVIYFFPEYNSSSYNSPITVALIKGYSFTEIKETPLPYLSSISIVSAMVAAFWTAFILPGSKFKAIKILIAPWVAVLFTGPAWGLIWSINRWPAETFHDFDTLLLFRRSDITSGLNLSLLSAAQSFPINIISYFVFCGLLYASMKIIENQKGSL